MKALLLLPLLLLIGCPAVIDQQKAANAAANIATTVKAAQDVEIAVFNSGQSCLQTAPDKSGCIVITPDEHVFIQQQFKSMGLMEKSLDSCIKSATTRAAIVTCTDSAVATIDELNSQGALHLKSDKAKSTYFYTMSTAKLGIQTIATLLGGS